jgi:hypothetical protein
MALQEMKDSIAAHYRAAEKLDGAQDERRVLGIFRSCWLSKHSEPFFSNLLLHIVLDNRNEHPG